MRCKQVPIGNINYIGGNKDRGSNPLLSTMIESGLGIMNLKLLIKLILKKLHIPCFWDPGQSFCKNCGCKVHDFIVDDELWELIESDIKYGNVLCYNCFCEFIKEKTNYSVFKLEGIE